LIDRLVNNEERVDPPLTDRPWINYDVLGQMERINLLFIVNARTEITVLLRSHDQLRRAFSAVADYFSFNPACCLFVGLDGQVLSGHERPSQIGWGSQSTINVFY
jgi:hypothetical protein